MRMGKGLIAFMLMSMLLVLGLPGPAWARGEEFAGVGFLEATSLTVFYSRQFGVLDYGAFGLAGLTAPPGTHLGAELWVEGLGVRLGFDGVMLTSIGPMRSIRDCPIRAGSQ